MKMVPRFLSASLFVMFFLFGSFFISSAIVHAGTFAGGNGSATYPYQVATCEQLQAMSDSSGHYYILTGDIDCSGSNTWNGGLGFAPLTFQGNFDGRNHTIQDLYINDPTSSNLGLFFDVENSVIKNLKMTGTQVTGFDYIAGMFSSISNSQVSGVSFSGNVTGHSNVAGIAESATSTDFSRCSVSGTITDTLSNVGALANFFGPGTISDSYSDATLVGHNGMGGLIDFAYIAPVVIERSFVAGSLADNSYQGGLIGYLNTNNVTVSNSLVVASISASIPSVHKAAFYFFMSSYSPTQSQNYYDEKQVTTVDCGNNHYNNAQCIGVSGVDGGGAATYPFKNTVAVAPYTAWNFTNMWQQTADYPTLRDAPLDPLATFTPTLSDTLTRIKAGTPSDHQLDFDTVNGLQNSGDTLVVDFGSAWNLSALTLSDLILVDNGNFTLDTAPGADTWGVAFDTVNGKITFTAPTSGQSYSYINPLDTLQLLIGTNTGGSNQIINPAAVSSYPVRITFTNSLSGTESYGYTIPIIDSDQVNVTSFINTYINFDLNVGNAMNMIGGPQNDGTGIGANREMETICDPSGVHTCQIYEGYSNGATNYTVDFGNLVPGTLNASGVTVYHDLSPGEINYIALVLSSNAANGTTVSMASQNGALTRAGGAPDNWDIPSGSHGAGVPVVTAPINFTALANSSGKAYGFKFVGTPSYIKIGTGANDPATTMQNVTGCKGTDATYCTLTTAPQTILTTGDTVEGLTATLGLGALANGTNPAGTYTDTLTFIATGTF